jgi:hypothetical protein
MMSDTGSSKDKREASDVDDTQHATDSKDTVVGEFKKDVRRSER